MIKRNWLTLSLLLLELNALPVWAQTGQYFDLLRTQKVASTPLLEWKQFGPGMSGYCEEFWCHPTDPNTLFMGPDMHVSYGSWDHGQSWATLKDPDGQGLDMKRVLDITFSRQDPNFALSIDWDGLVFRTEDRGHHWKQIGDLGKRHSALAVDPTNDQVWYVGAGDFWNVKDNHHSLKEPHGIILPQAVYGHIWKSTDKGQTWKKITNGLPERVDVGKIIVDPRNPQLVLAATGHGVFRSTDGGLHWKPSGQGLPNNISRDMTSFYDPKTGAFKLYLVEQSVYEPDHQGGIRVKGGIYQSDDAGLTWSSITGNLAIDLNRLQYQGAKERYYRCIAYWLGITPAEAKTKYPRIPSSIYTVFNRIVVNPNDANEIYISHNLKHDFSFPPGDVWKTTDGGKTWIATVRAGKYWKENTDSAYWKSRNNPLGMNVTFAHMQSDLEHHDEYQGNRFLEINSLGEVYACIDQQVIRTDSKGKEWKQIDDIEISPGSKKWIGRGDSNLPGRYILLETGVKGKQLFCSGEHGLWQTASLDDYPDKTAMAVEQIEGQKNPGGALSIATVAVHPQNPNMMYLLTFRQNHRGKFRRSTDGGEHWEDIASIFEADSPEHRTANVPYSLLIDPNHPENIYFCSTYVPVTEVGGGRGPELKKGGYGVYRSTDGGFTWQHNPEDFPKGSSVNRLAMDPADPSILYAALNVGGGLYRTTDRGQHWSKMSIPAPIKSVNNVFVDKQTRALYISCGSRSGKPEEGGVWRSKDMGNHWEKIFDMPNVWQTETSPLNPDIIIVSSAGQVPTLATNPLNPGAYLSTDGGNTWNKVNTNLGQPDKIVDIKPDNSDESVFWCALWGSGWYKATLKKP